MPVPMPFPPNWQPPWGWHSYTITDQYGKPVRLFELPVGPMLDLVRGRLRERIFFYRSRIAEFHEVGGDWKVFAKIKRLMYADESMLNYISKSKAVQTAMAYPPALGIAYHAKWLGAWGLIFAALSLLREKPKTILDRITPEYPIISPSILNDFDGTNPDELVITHSEMPLQKHSLHGTGTAGSTALRLETKSGLRGERHWIRIVKYFDPPGRRYIGVGVNTRCLYPGDIHLFAIRLRIAMDDHMAHAGIEHRDDPYRPPFFLYTYDPEKPTTFTMGPTYIPNAYNTSAFCIDLQTQEYVSAFPLNQTVHPNGAHFCIESALASAACSVAITYVIEAKHRISIDIDRIMVMECGSALPLPQEELPPEKR